MAAERPTFDPNQRAQQRAVFAAEIEGLSSAEVTIALQGMLNQTNRWGVGQFGPGRDSSGFLNELGKTSERYISTAEKYLFSPLGVEHMASDLNSKPIKVRVKETGNDVIVGAVLPFSRSIKEHLLFMDNGLVSKISPKDQEHFSIYIRMSEGPGMYYALGIEEFDEEMKLSPQGMVRILNMIHEFTNFDLVSEVPEQRDKIFPLIEKALGLRDPLLTQIEDELALSKKKQIAAEVRIFGDQIDLYESQQKRRRD